MDRIEQKNARLSAEMTLRNLFGIIFENENAPQAMFLDADQQAQTVTFAQCRERVYAAAQALRQAGVMEGAYIALQLDTCPSWFTLYWAVILSGANALLLDPMHGEEMTAYLLRQAGACGVIAAVKRPGLSGVRQWTAEELMAAPPASRSI